MKSLAYIVIYVSIGVALGWLLLPRRKAEPHSYYAVRNAVNNAVSWWTADGETYANTTPWWVMYS